MYYLYVEDQNNKYFLLSLKENNEFNNITNDLIHKILSIKERIICSSHPILLVIKCLRHQHR